LKYSPPPLSSPLKGEEMKRAKSFLRGEEILEGLFIPQGGGDEKI